MFCLYTPAFTTIMPLQVLSVLSDSWIHASCASIVSPQWDVLCVRDRRRDASSVAAELTCAHVIVTCVRLSEGDQMLRVFSCQATVQRWAQSLISPEFYYITATDTSLISDLEHSLRITCCYRLLPQSELLVTALLSIYRGGDVSVTGQALDFPVGKHADSCDSKTADNRDD